MSTVVAVGVLAPAGRVSSKTGREALLLLFEIVRDEEITVEEALACLRFGPPEVCKEGEPLRFRFDSGPDGFRLLLLMARDRIHTPEKILSNFAFE